jgi:hypothetical protein
MFDDPRFGTGLLVIVFFFPVIGYLVLAWLGWFGNRRRTIKAWRVRTFRWALFIAAVDTAAFVPVGVLLLQPAEQARGLLRLAGRLGTVLWILSLAGSLAGKGSERILLFCWGILLILGVFAIATVSGV